MRKQILLVAIILSISSVFVVAQEQELINFNVYHNTEKFNQKLSDISNQCDGRLEIKKIGNNPELNLVTINASKQAQNKAFLLFGEHPRELISSETGLHLVQKICNNESPLTQRVNEQFELQIILNANPISRQQVEEGNFCLRENEKGVDINRNYDAHWEKVDDDVRQVTSGDHPFSESETQTISEQVKKFSPDFFLSIHSGTYGMYTPYAYSEDLAQVNENNMMDILEKVNDEHCQVCGVGAAGKEVGYLCPGTCLDWAYDAVGIQYSFAIEIYQNGIDLRDEIQNVDQDELAFLQIQNVQNKNFLGKKTADEDKSSKQEKKENEKSCFLQNKEKAKYTDDISEYEKCFLFFNPEEKDHYEFIVENWSNAIMKMMDMTSQKRQAAML